MFSQIADLLIRTAFGFFVYALLLRFYMQALRAPFRNPVGQFVTALTDWAVRPARRLIPGLFGVDLASILIAWFIEALLLVLLYWLKGFSFAGAPGIAAGLVFTIAAMDLLRASLYLLIGVIIVQVIISWVNPYAPLAPVFDALTRPFYAVFRRFVPPIGNVDLSPLFVLLLAQPGAKTSAIAGIHGEALKIRLTARPAEGRANEALVALLAGALGVPKGSVRVVKGGASRQKAVLVAAPQADPGRLLRT